VATTRIDITRKVDIGEFETLLPPRKPGVPGLVVHERQGVRALAGIDVIGPQRAGLVEMMVRIHDRRGDRHLCAASHAAGRSTSGRRPQRP
jgi:hypothetical protein